MGHAEPSPNSDTDSLPPLAHQLRERVKELNCLFGISEILENSGGSLDRILQETVELLPRSWDHTEVACARISLGEGDFRSEGYQASPWTQTSEIKVLGKAVGTIELAYREARPKRDEGPFSREERRLLNAVAERLGHVAERLTADERLRKKEEEFRERITHVTRISTLGEMASSIAHEVNQPLTAVATYAQACRRMVEMGAVEKPEVLEVLERISEEALRAGEIIHRLRGMVRRQESEMAERDVTLLLNEIAPLASVDCRMNDVELEITLPDHPQKILADGVQIQQVVLNLIRNGIDAMADMPRDQRKLEVRVVAPDRETVELSVSDRGCGLPEESEKTLFEPFFTTKESGLGLGLSISRSIVSAHGGDLSFSRNPDGGTTFFFSLPIAREAEDE